MKKLMTAILILTSLSAIAGAGPGSSWDQINADYSLRVEGPQVRFSTNSGTNFTSIMDVCYLPASNELRTLKKVATYNRVSRGDHDEWIFTGKKYLVTSLTYTRGYCSGQGDNCGEWVEYEATYPLSAVMTVSEEPLGDNDSGMFGTNSFEKEYNVPTCK